MDPGSPQPLRSTRNRRDIFVLAAIWVASVAFDLLWIQHQQIPPAWDQGEHLSRAIGIWSVLRQPAPWNGDWWFQLWAEAPTYRGPLTYLLTAPVFELLGPSFKSAMAANGLWNGLLLLSCYGLGRQAHSRSAGLWCAFFAAVSPALLNQRTDFLIDLSLTAVLSSCWWLLSQWRWHAKESRWSWSLLSGVGLASVFLTRPTGLVLLWLPLMLLAIQALRAARTRHWELVVQLLAAASLAYALSWPWFSQNWLTILSTINKARQWGVAYQEGLEANSLEGWLYYPRLLPTMAGGVLVALVVFGAGLAQIQRPKPLNQEALPAGWWLWWLSLPLGGLLVSTLMTSKDFRFVLPLLPQLCLGLGVLMARVRTRWAMPWRIAILAIGLQTALWNQWGWGMNLSGFPSHWPAREPGWPIEEIVSTVRSRSPHQLSTIAVLPDSERFNAFNLDAEGRRQQGRVAARQTVAPLETAGNDLNHFDWFVIKNGDQGVMSDERQARQASLVSASPAFVEAGRWTLPDGSKALLMQRRELSLDVQPINTCSSGVVKVSLQGNPAGVAITVQGPISRLRGARLMIERADAKAARRADQAVGLGLLKLEDLSADSCIRVHQQLANIGAVSDENMRVRLLDSNNKVQQAEVEILPAGTSAEDHLINRVSELRALGGLLKRGQVDELFSRVGPLNQSDPNQAYLADGEAIFKARLQQQPDNMGDLYALAVAQALQRKAADAAQTLEHITERDPTNANALMGLGVVQLYRFKPWAAQKVLDAAAKLMPDNPTLTTLRIVASALRLDLRTTQQLLN